MDDACVVRELHQREVYLVAHNGLTNCDYYADAVGELILSRVGVSFLWRRKALRPYGSSPILIRQQHLRYRNRIK